MQRSSSSPAILVQAVGGDTTETEPPAPATTDEHDGAARRRRRRWPLAAGVAAALLVAGVVIAAFPRSSQPGVQLTAKGGGAAKSFRLPNLREGQPTVDLGQLRGRPVVVNFWASWCIPCRHEMPAFEAVYER